MMIIRIPQAAPPTRLPGCLAAWLLLQCSTWVFGDVVFQDVGFEHNSLKPLIHSSFRCDVPTPSVVEGQSTIIIQPHILKHHIPELPNHKIL